MKVKDLVSAFADNTRYLVGVTIDDLKIKVFDSEMVTSAKFDVPMSKAVMLDNMGNMEIEDVNQTIISEGEEDFPAMKITTAKPVIVELAKDEVIVTEPDQVVTETESEDDGSSLVEQEIDYDEAYASLLEERDNLRSLKKSGKAGPEDLNWLSNIRQAITDFNPAKEAGTLQDWFNQYHYLLVEQKEEE